MLSAVMVNDIMPIVAAAYFCLYFKIDITFDLLILPLGKLVCSFVC